MLPKIKARTVLFHHDRIYDSCAVIQDVVRKRHAGNQCYVDKEVNVILEYN